MCKHHAIHRFIVYAARAGGTYLSWRMADAAKTDSASWVTKKTGVYTDHYQSTYQFCTAIPYQHSLLSVLHNRDTLKFQTSSERRRVLEWSYWRSQWELAEPPFLFFNPPYTISEALKCLAGVCLSENVSVCSHAPKPLHCLCTYKSTHLDLSLSNSIINKASLDLYTKM